MEQPEEERKNARMQTIYTILQPILCLVIPIVLLVIGIHVLQIVL